LTQHPQLTPRSVSAVTKIANAFLNSLKDSIPVCMIIQIKDISRSTLHSRGYLLSRSGTKELDDIQTDLIYKKYMLYHPNIVVNRTTSLMKVCPVTERTVEMISQVPFLEALLVKHMHALKLTDLLGAQNGLQTNNTVRGLAEPDRKDTKDRTSEARASRGSVIPYKLIINSVRQA